MNLTCQLIFLCFVFISQLVRGQTAWPIELITSADKSGPPVRNAGNAKVPWKPVIYVQGNIHGGKVEGMEATMMPMREILLDDTCYLLDHQIILFAPINNTGSSDKIEAVTTPSEEESPREASYHLPRYLGNQFGLHNRMAILSEAFSRERFFQGISSTYYFVAEILNYAHLHPKEIQSINKKSEEAAIRNVINLIFYMLAPQSDDGVVTWNFFDSDLEQRGVNNTPVQYPVFKYIHLNI